MVPLGFLVEPFCNGDGPRTGALSTKVKIFLLVEPHPTTPDCPENINYRDGFAGAIPRRVRPRGYRFIQRPPAERSEASSRAEARLRGRAKRGSTERSEAPTRLRRAKRCRAKGGGPRSPLQKNSKRFHQRKPTGEPLISFTGVI